MSDTRKYNEKLPLGSFYYIKVGHRFYAGEIFETREYEVVEPIYIQPKDKRPFYNDWSWGRRKDARQIKDNRKGTLATYLQRKSKSEKIMKTEITPISHTRLVDTVEEAKHFRRKTQAQKACDRLESVYSDLDIKVTIKEGDSK